LGQKIKGGYNMENLKIDKYLKLERENRKVARGLK
jgi:hypothetical protein